MALSILFIGGTGNISLPCVKDALAQGHKVSVFNRGQRGAPLPEGVTSITGDMANDADYAKLGDESYDVVCQFMAFRPDQMERDIATFTGKTKQYIFISSASVYEKPPRHYVITEQTPAVNPHWLYSRNKIACEELLHKSSGLNWTIVRPSHTLRTGLPTMMEPGPSLVHRLKAGKPVIVAGDGATPWTITRCEDFAVPFVRLFGLDAAIGETVHITNDIAFTWNDIYRAIADGFGSKSEIVHVPTDTLVRYQPDWEGPLLGDKTWSALFDNSRLRGLVGDFTCSHDLAEILSEPIRHAKAAAEADASVDTALDALMDRIIAEQNALGR